MIRIFCDVADRLAGLMSLCFLLASLVMLAQAGDARYVFWAVCALGLSGVALWAHLGEGGWCENDE